MVIINIKRQFPQISKLCVEGKSQVNPLHHECEKIACYTQVRWPMPSKYGRLTNSPTQVHMTYETRSCEEKKEGNSFSILLDIFLWFNLWY